MQLASRVAPLYNTLIKVKPIRQLINRIAGFHPERTLPEVYAQSLRLWFSMRHELANRRLGTRDEGGEERHKLANRRLGTGDR
jgi:hypothetical protein